MKTLDMEYIEHHAPPSFMIEKHHPFERLLLWRFYLAFCFGLLVQDAHEKKC